MMEDNIKKHDMKTYTPTDMKVRGKRRKKYRSYSPTALTNALKAVTEENISVHKASKIFSVPETTIRDRINGRVRTLKSGPNPLFNEEEEGIMAAHFQTLCCMGYHFSRAEMLEVASDYLITKGIRDKDNPLSHTWFYGFMTRWPELEMIRLKLVSEMRARALSDECTNFYFTELKNILEEYSILEKPECIYLMDEDDIYTDLNKMYATEEDPYTNPLIATMIGCGNANGNSLPPFFVFPGYDSCDDVMSGCTEGVSVASSENGKLTVDTFQLYLQDHFMNNIDRNSEYVALLYNANRPYIPLSTIDWARDNNIILFPIPPYLSHIVQLDGISCFKDFDLILKEERQKYMKSNQTNINASNVCEVACMAYTQAFSSENLKVAFSKAGIVPLDKNVIDNSSSLPLPDNVQVKLEIEEVEDDYLECTENEWNENHAAEPQSRSVTSNIMNRYKESQNGIDINDCVSSRLNGTPAKADSANRTLKRKRSDLDSLDQNILMFQVNRGENLQNGLDAANKSLTKPVTNYYTAKEPLAATNLTEPMTGDDVLLEPYDYICQIPGKQVRSKLAAAFDSWMKIPSDKLKIIGEATQMLHNASLLIDDIEDNSKLRRGIPVAHNIYGVAHTINSANYVYFLGLDKVLQLNHPDATRVFTEQLLELHRGQGMDIYWRDTVKCPTEDEYKQMVIRKTGGLFGLAVRLMQLFSDNQSIFQAVMMKAGGSTSKHLTEMEQVSDFKPLLDTLGLYFQIRDDYANMMSKEYEANKSFCEDLTEGKFSFPTIHAIKNSTDSSQILSILRQRTTDNDVKKYCIDCLEKAGSFEYTKQTLLDLEQRIFQLMEEHGGNKILSGLINELGKLYRENQH